MQENNHGQKQCKGKMCSFLLYRNAIGLACRLLTCFCVGGSLCWRVVACACRCVAIVRLSFLWRVVSLAVGLSLHWRAAAWTYNCVGVSLRWRVDGASLRWRVASLTCRCCRCVDVSLRSRVVALACRGFDVSLSWHVVGNRSLLCGLLALWLA